MSFPVGKARSHLILSCKHTQCLISEGDQRMNFRSLASFAVPGAAVFSMLAVGCVDIPSEGHTPPDYQAEVRIVYADPFVGTAAIRMAPGPDFNAYSDLPSGIYGTATASYVVIPAGNKKLFLKDAAADSTVDHDTSSIAFNPDQHGTMIVFPRPDSTVSRFVFLDERYSFAQGGIADTTRVLFINATARAVTDTADLALDINMIATVDTTTETSTAVAGLAFRDVSDYINVPSGDAVSFYLTIAGTSTVVSDTIPITGASNSDVTFVAHDSLAAGKVQFLKLDNE